MSNKQIKRYNKAIKKREAEQRKKTMNQLQDGKKEFIREMVITMKKEPWYKRIIISSLILWGRVK